MVNGALTIGNFSIASIGGYISDSTPGMAIAVSGNEGETNMSFSCNGTAFTVPVPYSPTHDQFDITNAAAGCSSVDGPRDVNVLVQDPDENASTVAQTNLDRVGPTISNPQPANGSSTNNKKPDINFLFATIGSWIVGPPFDANVSLKVNGVPVALTFLTDINQAKYSPPTDFNDGIVQIQADANDGVGNHTTTSWSFEVDTNARLTAIMIDGNRSFVNSLDANMTISGDSDLNACHFKTTGAYGSWQATSGIMTIRLETGDGNKTVTGQCKDEVENPTEERSATIGLDTLVPGTPAPTIIRVYTNQVDLHWTAVTDNGISGLKEYEILKNGVLVATGISIKTLDYNVTGLTSNTAYTFRLIARDNAGNESFAQQTAVTSGGDTNQPNDTIPPIVSWIKPDNNATIFGTNTLQVQLSDNRSLKEVYFYLDDLNSAHQIGWVLASGVSYTAQLQWNASSATLGLHQLIARAEDQAGNRAQASRSVNIIADTNADQNQDQNRELVFSFGLSFKTNLLSRQIPLLNQLESKLDFSKKRIALEKEVQFTRKIDVFRITQQGTTVRYKNVFTLEAKNLLPQKIKSLDIIEQLPKEWVPDPSKLRFDHNYQILEADPIVQISLDNLDINQTAVLSYYFETDSNQNPVTKESFQQLAPPLGLITLKSGDACFNVSCNDSNPCSIDYCEEGNCKTAAKPNGTSCGTTMACQEGICVSTLPPVPQTDWSFLWIGGGIIGGLVLLLVIGSYVMQKVKKMQKTAKVKTPPSDEELKRMLQQSLEWKQIIPKQEMPAQAPPEAMQSLEQTIQQQTMQEQQATEQSSQQPVMPGQSGLQQSTPEQSTQEQPVPETPSQPSANESEVKAGIQELKQAQSLPEEKKPKKSANSDTVGSLLKDALKEKKAKQKPEKKNPSSNQA